ncbi:MAG: hypothetical protein R6U17_01100 [Thermoplasmata archaeon]
MNLGIKKKKKDFPSFLTYLIDADITVHQGCTVELEGKCRAKFVALVVMVRYLR